MVGFNVLAERCNQCLYGKDKIVSNTRRADLLRGLNAKDDYFVCHKASLVGVTAACRGDWDQRGCGQLGRIADRLGLVNFIAETDLKTLPQDQ
jgi:hypothetical protein